MKLGLVTIIADEFSRKLSSQSIEPIQAYSKKIGAQLITSCVSPKNETTEKFKLIRSALKECDRVVFIDPKVLVRFDCPNLFQTVPEGKLGVFDEAECNPALKAFAKDYLPVSDKDLKHIFNTCVIVCDRQHLPLFADPAVEVSPREEQAVFSKRVADAGTALHLLPHRFNRLLRTLQLTGEQIEDSFIANFSDGFETAEGREHEPNLIAWKTIAETFENYAKAGVVPRFFKRIYLETAGALGDVVATEPVVRYVRKVLEPDAEIVIKAEFPDVFDHIASHPRTIILGPNETTSDRGHLKFFLFPDPPIANYNLMRPADYAALAVFRGMLPDAHRRIQLQVPEAEPLEICDHVLVHAGLSWESKTFPADWWNAVIQGMIRKGLKVALIGRTYEGNWRGTVDIDSSGCWDLRNKTTLKELFGLIRLSPLLVTNDSSPVHISGAFDNHTIMITSAKHPDYIWPTRDPSLNITMGKPMKNGAPAIGLVNSIYMDRCERDELLAVLPDPRDVVQKAYQVWKKKFPYGNATSATISSLHRPAAGGECVPAETPH